MNTWLHVFPSFCRATPVVLPGTGGSWQCCLWKTELSWLYWLWPPLKIVLSPSDAYWYLWLAKDPDNMDFSCEWAPKTSHDRLFWGRAKGEGLFWVFFFKDSVKKEQPFLTVSSIHRLHRFVILGIHQTLHSLLLSWWNLSLYKAVLQLERSW